MFLEITWLHLVRDLFRIIALSFMLSGVEPGTGRSLTGVLTRGCVWNANSVSVAVMKWHYLHFVYIAIFLSPLSGEVSWLFDTSRGRDYKILLSFQGLEMTASVQQQQRCPPTYCPQQPAVVENVSRLLTSLLLSKQLVPHLTDQCHESQTSPQSWQLLKTLYNHCNYRSLVGIKIKIQTGWSAPDIYEYTDWISSTRSWRSCQV